MIVPLVQSVSHSLSDVIEMACGVGSTMSWPGKAWLCWCSEREGSALAACSHSRCRESSGSWMSEELFHFQHAALCHVHSRWCT